MNKIADEEYKIKIRQFFKELINIYKSQNYEEEIIEIKSSKNGIPIFELRFIKHETERKYFRILLDDQEIN